MSSSNLLFFGQDENSLKKKIIDILTHKWPLTINEIHLIIKKELYLKISYQAVHKAIKQMKKSGCIELKNKKIRISSDWVNKVEEELNKIKENYKLNLTEHPKFNVISIKNSSVYNPHKEKQVVSLIEKVTPILKKTYKTHNIFEKGEEEVMNYLFQSQKKNEMFILMVKGHEVGVVILIKEDETPSLDYSRWSLSHFACNEEIDEQHKLDFIKTIEEKILLKHNKIKIEYHLAETETEYITLFKKAGYKKESTLKGRYRPNEIVYIYSKYIEDYNGFSKL